MSDFQLDILKKLNELGEIKSTLQVFADKDSQDVLSALNSLKAHSKLNYTKHDTILYDLSTEGQDILNNGSHEMKLLKLIKEVGNLKISDVNAKLGKDGKLGQARAFKNGWIKKNENNELEVNEKGKNDVEDTTQVELKAIVEGKADSLDKNVVNDLKKRKLITPKKLTDFEVVKGAEFSLEIKNWKLI